MCSWPLNQVVLVLEHANGGMLRDQMEGLMSEDRLRDSVARPLLQALSALQAQVRGLGQVLVELQHVRGTARSGRGWNERLLPPVLHLSKGLVRMYTCRDQTGELGSAAGGAGFCCLSSGSF